MLKIITDGGADMPDSWEKDYEINILPLRVLIGEKTYFQGIDLNFHNFYRILREMKVIPKTSLPSPHQVKEFYRSIAQKGDTILSLHLSSKLSGTFNAFQVAAKELAQEYNIYLFDSLAGSTVLGFMCREARLMERAGASINDILMRMEEIKQKVVVILTLDNLEFAHKNGRIGVLQNLLGSMLNIKPVLVLKDGLLEMYGKARTRQKALEQILNYVSEKIGSKLANVAVVHASDLPTAEHLKARIQGMLQIDNLVITDLSIPVAANLGPGAVGIVAYPSREENE
ncbi:MAG: DegV family protein [Anaerolineaceae bacterium]